MVSKVRTLEKVCLANNRNSNAVNHHAGQAGALLVCQFAQQPDELRLVLLFSGHQLNGLYKSRNVNPDTLETNELIVDLWRTRAG